MGKAKRDKLKSGQVEKLQREMKNSFEGHTKDLKGHITAYQKGEIDEETLITLIEVSLVKLKLVSEKTIKKMIGVVDGV